MDLVARRIVLPEGDAVTGLPTIVKRDALDAHLASSSVLERAEVRAASIVAAARSRADGERLAIEEERSRSAERGYRDGCERARTEAAAELLDLSHAAAGFVADIESALVAAVLSAVREISARLDDATLVEATVRRGLHTIGEGVRATLRVAVPLEADVQRRVSELPGAASVGVIGDPLLSGADCRLESGRMVIVGNLDQQLDAMRIALEGKIALACAAIDDRTPSGAAAREHDTDDDSSRRDEHREHDGGG